MRTEVYGLLDRSTVEIEVVDIEPFVNEACCGFTIYWKGSIGFGQYTIYKSAVDNQWRADSEYMDSADDTWFLDKLIEKFKSCLDFV